MAGSKEKSATLKVLSLSHQIVQQHSGIKIGKSMNKNSRLHKNQNVFVTYRSKLHSFLTTMKEIGLKAFLFGV